MAIYQDDFQGYAIGAVAPFGSLTNFGFFSTTIIDVNALDPLSNPPGMFGNTRCVRFFGSGLQLNTGATYTPAVSVFFGARFHSWAESIMALESGSAAIGSVYRNEDGTISIFVGGTRIATSIASLKWFQWNWFQCNFSYSNNGGFLQIDAEIAVDEVSILTVSYVSGITIASLTGVGVNKYNWSNTYAFSNLTVDVIQPIGTDPNPGAPADRATQATIEQAQLPSSALVRVTQGTLEQAQLPSTAMVRVTQGVIELVIGPATLAVTCTQTPSGTVGIPYISSVTGSGGVPPYTFAVTAGALPPGLTMASDGTISGTPTTAGSYSFTVTVTGADGATAVSACTVVSGIGIVIAETGLCAKRVGPIIYFWEPSFLDRPEDTAMRATDWDNAGLEGAKFVQGFLLEADTEGEDKIIKLQGDQQDLQTYTINHDGQLIKPYVLNPAKIASLLRLISTDDVPWRYFAIRPIWEPLPELVTYYETQGTTHDIPGYQFLKDGYISLISTDTVTLTVNVDGVNYAYTIPSTSGAHAKVYMIFGINGSSGRTLKGKEYRYILSSPAGFRLYQKDCEVRVHAWSGGDYQVKQPFGEVSRIQGAKI